LTFFIVDSGKKKKKNKGQVEETVAVEGKRYFN